MIYNPAGLYGGGAFKIDTTAAANYFLKKQAQDQAQEATLNKYFSTLDDKATDKGVRDQEVSSFYKAKQDYQDFYTKNSKALASGTRPDLTREAQRLAKVPFQIASESRNALANTKIIGQVRATSQDVAAQYSMETLGVDQTGKPIIDPDTKSYTGLYANDQPIYIENENGQLIKNPNYKAFDLTTDIVLNPKELTGKEMQDYADNQVSNIKPTEKPVATRPDPNRKFYDIESIETGYDDPQLKAVGDQMKDLFKDKRINYTWKKQHPFKEWTDQNAAQFAQANDVYKRIYGKDIENDDELYAGIQMAIDNGATEIFTILLSPDTKTIDDQEYINLFSILQKTIDIFTDDVGKNDLIIPAQYNEALNYIDAVKKKMQMGGLSDASIKEYFTIAGMESPFENKIPLKLFFFRPSSPLGGGPGGLTFDPVEMKGMLQKGATAAENFIASLNPADNTWT